MLVCTWLGGINLKYLAALILLTAATVYGQAAAGVAGITGTVRDPSGAAVPNAKIVISNASQGQLRSLDTNQAGLFNAPALTPRSGYSVNVTAAGFAPYDLKDITLEVGQNLNLNIDLQLQQSSTEVVVSAAAGVVSDTRTDVSTVINTEDVSQLPINGRRVDQFVLLAPGVTNDATFGLLSFRGVAGNNSFLLDGIDTTEQFYDENAGRTRIQTQLSPDAVQEFQVVSTDYSAEYGRAMGGVVNTVTRSGSNQFHGVGFYYFRSTGFDARDAFAAFNPPEKRIQTGGTIGGPIIKDKLFFLLNADITYRYFPITDSFTSVPTYINPTTGLWVTTGSQACQAPATSAQCAAINTLLPRFFAEIPRTGYNDLGFGRVDYHASDKHTFTMEFNFLRWWSPNGIQTGASYTNGAAINNNGNDSVRLRQGKLSYTWVPTSSFVNTFRFGADTDRQADTFDSSLLGGGLGYLDVSVGGAQLGPVNYLPRVEPSETRYELADDANYIRGNHSFKFGYSFFTTEDYVYYISNANGSYTYGNPTAFAEDYSNAAGQVGPATGKNWQTYTQTFGNPVADYRMNEMAAYALDQWKVNSKLTVNLGVRWDKSLGLTFPVTNPDWPDTGFIHTPDANFAPRVGLAYKINDKTVFRGGYGMFYARMIGGLIDDLYTNNGLYQTSITLNSSNAAQLAAGPTFPNILTSIPAGASVSASSVQFAAPNLKTPYSSQGNVTMERELPGDMVLSVSGIFSRGIHLLGDTDVNAPPATCCFTYTIDNGSGQPVGSWTTPIYLNPRPNTKYGTVYEVTNGVDSVYDALAVTLNKRFSHGFQMLASYTWGHEIDDGQGQATNAIYFSTISTLYNGDNSAERANGWLDQRQRFVYSAIWQPTIRTDNGFVKAVLNNWQISTITTLASGLPYASPSISVSSGLSACTATVTTGCLPAGESLISSSYPDGFPGSKRAGFLPVNSILTPATYRADARLSKIIPITIHDDATRLSLNFEVFNVSNSWSPTAMTSTEYIQKGGVLTLDTAAGAYGTGTADGGFPDGTQARRMQISARWAF